jgi:menaquinone-dependent protoporphyrinogen oxidase
MTVLVCAASKHGATAEIAEAIGRVLRDRGIAVDVRSAENVTMVDGYDAVVLGSAVYVGHWLEPARRLVDSAGLALARRPVWLFSSGPIGDPAKPTEDPVDVAAVVQATGARDHRIFAGRLDKHLLGFGERAMVAALRAPTGDFRDWPAIEAWAAGIAETLTAEEAGRDRTGAH